MVFRFRNKIAIATGLEHITLIRFNWRETWLWIQYPLSSLNWQWDIAAHDDKHLFAKCFLQRDMQVQSGYFVAFCLLLLVPCTPIKPRCDVTV